MHLTPEQRFLDSFRPCAESRALADFAAEESSGRVLDVGCGTGFLSFALLLSSPRIDSVLGIDLNAELISEAARNECAWARNHQNVDFLIMDARHQGIASGAFDCVVCNPPFFVAQQSRQARQPARAVARQDTALTLPDVFSLSRYALRPEGILSLVLPANRLCDVNTCCEEQGAEITRSRLHADIRKRDGGIVLLKIRFRSYTTVLK